MINNALKINNNVIVKSCMLKDCKEIYPLCKPGTLINT